jgi:hypothetical protein
MPGLKKFRQNPQIFTNQFGAEDSKKNNFILEKLQQHLFEFRFTSKSVEYYPYPTNLLACILLLFKSDITWIICFA